MKKYDDNDKRENTFLNFDVIEDKKSGKFVIIEKNGKKAFGTEKKEKERDFFVLTLIGCVILSVAVIFLLVGLLKYEEDPDFERPQHQPDGPEGKECVRQ
jgi:hypothetical protein